MITELPLYNKILILFIDLIAIWLAIIVYNSNRKGKLNKIFLEMIVLMFFWVNFAYLARLIGQQSPDLGLIFLKIAWSASPFLFVLLYFLVVFYLNKEKSYSILSKIIFLSGLIVSLITIFTSLVVKEMEFVGINLTIIYGEGMFPFLGIVFFFMCAPLYLLFKEYIKCQPKERIKIEYLLIGIFIFYLANIIFGMVFPIFLKVVHLYWIGDYSVIFLLGFTAYAIVKHELFDIKVVLTSIFVSLIAILLALDALLFTEVFSIQILKGVALLIFLIFGHMLIESVFGEVKRRKELEKLSRAKTEFISMASHQLRTPLTAIKGYSSLILEGTYGKTEVKQKRVFKNIFVSTERLLKIVNDLLNISKIELGKVELEKEPVRIENLIDSVYLEMKPQAQEKGLKLIWQKPKQDLQEINIDSLKIRQAIFNIIDNAIKYTEKGSITIKIQNLTSKIQIVISDTGIGFTEDEKHRLFELFVRGRAGIDTFVEGTGIGLNVARKFVELHGGKIRAESQGKDKGAIFYIELPVR